MYALGGGLGSVDLMVVVGEDVEAVARYARKGSKKVGGRSADAVFNEGDLDSDLWSV